jgi:hypothetical protein
MQIREGSNSIEIVAVRRVPQHLPSAGDTELSVLVSANGFGGRGTVWVGAPRLAAFAVQLQELEDQRQGTATLEGIAREEFQLRIRSIDRQGHFAVSGKLACQVYADQRGPYLHAVEFGFEFDPTQLPQVLSGFRELAGDLA